MAPNELADFAARLGEWSLAFAEPWPMGSKFGMRSSGCWYHDYTAVFGRLMCNPARETKRSFSLGMAEYWLYGLVHRITTSR
jgi:hypothetical protein